jgi:hypothetical protein
MYPTSGYIFTDPNHINRVMSGDGKVRFNQYLINHPASRILFILSSASAILLAAVLQKSSPE